MGKELTTNKVAEAERLVPMPPGFVEFIGKSTIPAKSFINARRAIYELGINCWQDLFTGKKYIGGMALNSEVGGQLTDDVVSLVRVLIQQKFDFDPGLENTWTAINLACRENGRHPIKEYLTSCHETWRDFDGKSRIDTMLIDYFGAPDTEFIRAVSRIVMVASARRIFAPGAKFDYMVVLESEEGTNKSQGIAKLYGEAYFSDQTILGLSDKELQEAVRGRWGIECAELSGMRKAEVERVKAQISRQEDRARAAYARATSDVPRSCILWGTTNDVEYLRSLTGNRRFLPTPVGRIDVDAIERDRDMLWGEAMAAHLSGESIMLPEPLWVAAGMEQDARTMSEPWIDPVANAADAAKAHMNVWFGRGKPSSLDNDARTLGTVYQVVDTADGRKERITSAFVLWKVIGIPPSQQTAEQGKRLGYAMRKNGWEGTKALWIGSRTAKGFERRITDKEAGVV